MLSYQLATIIVDQIERRKLLDTEIEEIYSIDLNFKEFVVFLFAFFDNRCKNYCPIVRFDNGLQAQKELLLSIVLKI